MRVISMARTPEQDGAMGVKLRAPGLQNNCARTQLVNTTLPRQRTRFSLVIRRFYPGYFRLFREL